MAKNPFSISTSIPGLPGLPDLQIELVDIWTNPIHLYVADWQRIQTIKHPNIAGFENAVYQTILDPDFVMPSTVRDMVAIFESTGTGPYGRDLRVVIDYASPKFTKGKTRGKVTTAYDRDKERYPDPQVGAPMYAKGRGKVR
jgi:hypothetical protein